MWNYKIERILAAIVILIIGLAAIYNLGGFWFHLWERHQ